MLTIRQHGHKDESHWIEITPECAARYLFEDTHYEFLTQESNCRVYVDDAELLMASGWFRWRPSFYCGRVTVTVINALGSQTHYFIEVSPTDKKSAPAEFDEMVQTIRDFDQTLLGGPSSATMAFGNQGRAGLKADLVLLARLRLYGRDFLDCVSRIALSPHQRLSADRQQMPLSSVRRLHPGALRDRKLSSLVSSRTGTLEPSENLQVQAWTSTPSVDTPANRSLLSLLKRFRATVVSLREKVALLALPEQEEQQTIRANRRLEELDLLADKVTRLVQRHPFNSLKSGETGSCGLMQIAAQPEYNKAYRLGCAALSYQVDGTQPVDQLRVNFSWGIYETWSFLKTLKCIERVLGTTLTAATPKSTRADLAFYSQITPEHAVEVLFQAKFPSQNSRGKSGWSISRERYPDILIVERKGAAVRSIILDAKWRSGRLNVLEAMESAHIYHDSLRIESQAPSLCLLLLPGSSDVESLGKSEYIDAHGVGAIFEFSAHGTGAANLTELLERWFSE